MLKNKKILFIAPSFFGYEKDIMNELTSFGAEVDFFDERPFTSSIKKVLNRLDFTAFIRNSIDKYYSEIVTKSRVTKYDYLFVISPETMDADFVNGIKETNAKMKTILYMWDSFRNKRNAKKIIHCFDEVYSFDATDNNIGLLEKIKFLPLFYNDNFKCKFENKNTLKKYSIAFIGTVHSDRTKLAKVVLKQYEDIGYSTFSFFYCPSKFLFMLKKVFTNEFDYISYKDVSFKSMSKAEIKNVFLNSHAALDIQHPDQTGLTMRSIEMLGLNKKLITTNSDVINYDFYNDNNILIIDRDSPLISKKFIDSAYLNLDIKIYEQYALKNWISTIFELN